MSEASADGRSRPSRAPAPTPGMTVAQVADSTRVRATLVTAIEDDDFRALRRRRLRPRPPQEHRDLRSGIDPVALAGPVRRPARAPRAPRTRSAADRPAHARHRGRRQPRPRRARRHRSAPRSCGRGRGTNWTAVMALALVVVVGVGVISFLSNRRPATPRSRAPTPSQLGQPVGQRRAPTPTTDRPRPTARRPRAPPTSWPQADGVTRAARPSRAARRGCASPAANGKDALRGHAHARATPRPSATRRR